MAKTKNGNSNKTAKTQNAKRNIPKTQNAQNAKRIGINAKRIKNAKRKGAGRGYQKHQTQNVITCTVTKTHFVKTHFVKTHLRHNTQNVNVKTQQALHFCSLFVMHK